MRKPPWWVVLLLLSVGCTGPSPRPLPSLASPEVGKTPQPWLAQARRAMERRDWVRAESSLEQALRIAPRDPAVWLALARLRESQGQWQEAERLRARACRLRRRQGEVCD